MCVFTRSHGGDGPEEDPDGVPAADGVPVLLEVGGEGLVVQRLDYVHAGVVQRLLSGIRTIFAWVLERALTNMLKLIMIRANLLYDRGNTVCEISFRYHRDFYL